MTVAFLAALRRCLLVPHVLPLLATVAVGAALAHWLAVRALDAGPDSLAELRGGLMLLAALLHLGLCAPLALADELRDGLPALRRARGFGPGLLPRAAALFVSCLPACALVALVTGGLPARPGLLAASLAAWVGLGLALGALLPSAVLRAAFWVLGLASLVRGLLLDDAAARWLAWALPPLPAPDVPWSAAALWTVGALLLADWACARRWRQPA